MKKTTLCIFCTLILLQVACKKKETTISLLVGNWHMDYEAYDTNGNHIMDTGEILDSTNSWVKGGVNIFFDPGQSLRILDTRSYDTNTTTLSDNAGNYRYNENSQQLTITSMGTQNTYSVLVLNEQNLKLTGTDSDSMQVWRSYTRVK